MSKLQALLFLIPAFLAGCTSGDEYDELGSKSDYSVLQGLEINSRGKVVSEPAVKSVGEYWVLGTPSSDGKSTIWILLNPRASPFYKQIPEGTYTISRGQLDAIIESKAASATVEAALASHVAD